MTAQVDIAWVAKASNGAPGQDAISFLAQLLSVTGSTPTASLAAPIFGQSSNGFAVVRVVSGAVILSWGAAPAPSSTYGLHLGPGDYWDIPITAGQTISFIEGSIVVPTPPIDRGGTIVTGGLGQPAMPINTMRKGGWLQNPVEASESLFISMTGVATTTAGAGNQAELEPGGTFSLLQGEIVIAGAISVAAATAGHTFMGAEF